MYNFQTGRLFNFDSELGGHGYGLGREFELSVFQEDPD